LQLKKISMKRIFSFLFISSLFFLFSCHSNQSNANSNTDTTIAQSPLEKVPMYRTEIKKEPVAEYEEKIKGNLNDWKFSVKIYETQKTFYFLVKLQYEEVTGEDTLKLPNLGTKPQPAIHAGNEKYSCVLGFMDVQNKFNEYKVVSIEDGNIKLTVLKHYYGAVYTK
jgi:hypothetical protein